MARKPLHDCWKEIIADSERNKFSGGYWDEAIKVITDTPLKRYLVERFCN